MRNTEQSPTIKTCSTTLIRPHRSKWKLVVRVDGARKRRAAVASGVMHSQPQGRLIRRRPFDSMLLVGRNVDPVPRPHFDDFILETKTCRSLQDSNPFVLRLIVPEAVR